ncbi:mitochondrial splicing system protein [Lambiella insularis]|nr:mitochondrial splicing system protein [Lambiella insularis]
MFFQVYHALCPGACELKPRYATLRTLFEPRGEPRQVLDSNAIVLYFPAPKTVTGEDVLELHIHGGSAIVKAVLAAVSKVLTAPRINSRAIRYAEPGEFTRRAFYNNRLDLTQIEALGDSLSAETEQQRRIAVAGTRNTLTERYETWRSQLLYARGELEALIDFSEDQHFEESPRTLIASIASQVEHLRKKLNSSIRNASKGELVRNGIKVALLGAPNAGKSSLLNKIVGRDAAIVSKEAGTTRDVIEVNVDIGGFFCKFGDLAGLREHRHNITKTSRLTDSDEIGEIEKEGIRRAKKWILEADVLIIVLPIERLQSPSAEFSLKVTPQVFQILNECNAERQKFFFAINKVDLLGSEDAVNDAEVRGRIALPLKAMTQTQHGSQCFPISCLDVEARDRRNHAHSDGISELLNALTKSFKTMTTAESFDDNTHSYRASEEESLGASERHLLLLLQCEEHFKDFLHYVTDPQSDPGSGIDYQDMDFVLAAESLRGAADCLAKITGKGESGDVEEVLGVVFEKYVLSIFVGMSRSDRGRFCVGK